MRLATWNVNGIRARHERVLAWLAERRPDVLCLQETKTEDAGFPAEPFRALGYHLALSGQKAYNGVALLSRTPLEDVERGFADGGDDGEARFIAATTGGLRVASVYVPNGQAVGSDKFAWKLAWLDRLRGWVTRRLASGEPAALCGDFNVAPADLDVHDPAAWDGQVLCTSDERAALERVKAAGLIDVVRQLHPDGILYTWWDYRQLAFPKNRGLRIDHILVTPSLASRVTSATIDRDARKGPSPSDHAPSYIDLGTLFTSCVSGA